MNIPLTPIRFLRHAGEQYAPKTAVVCGDDRFTYAQFASRATRLAGALRNAGIQAGDRVAFLSTNCHRLLEAYYGVLEAGAVLLPLNIRLSSDELAYILNDAGATILFIEKALSTDRRIVSPKTSDRKAIRSAGRASPRNPGSRHRTTKRCLPRPSRYKRTSSTVDENAVAELFYTSGTSANPKGVMLTHRNIYLHALNACISIHARNESRRTCTRFLCFTPTAGASPIRLRFSAAST